MKTSPTKKSESTRAISAISIETLKLAPRLVRIFPKMNRRMRLVDSSLQSVFRSLVNGQRSWPLFLHGPVGAGKTMAALSLCDICQTAAYETVEGLSDRTMAVTPEELMAHWRRIALKDLAVLDELGSRKESGELQYGVVKRFADVRCQESNNVAIYVSNLSPSQLASAYDDRVGSRILCGTIFKLEGEDCRFK